MDTDSTHEGDSGPGVSLWRERSRSGLLYWLHPAVSPMTPPRTNERSQDPSEKYREPWEATHHD